MCGIHGFINGPTRENNADDFIKQAFTVNMLRGTDSSGIVAIDADADTAVIHKLPIAGNFFAEDKVALGLIRKAGYKNHMSICHVRAATSGSVNVSNAHPFQVTDENDEGVYTREIIGVHNGTLNGWKYKKQGNNYEVDSEWALNHILTEGADAFEDFTGAYCFVWWDSDDGKVLNIARNKERPMYVAFTKQGGMLYASEAGMIHWLASRNRIELDGNIKELMEGFHYKFDVSKVKEFTKTHLPQAKGYTTTYSSTHSNRTYSSTSNVEKVGAVLKAIAAAPASQAANVSTLPNTNTTVTRTEIEDAVTLGMVGVRGKFEPMYEDSVGGNLYGTMTFGATEMEGVMRGSAAIDWSVTDTYDVSILGVTDDGTNITCIVSKPRLSLVPDRNEAVH